MNSYCDPRKRHDFVYLFEVVNGNPNGDPDAGNMPRVDPQTYHGIVTDVCIKRKIRNYISLVHQLPVYIQSETALNTLARNVLRERKIMTIEADVTDFVNSEEFLSWIQDNASEYIEITPKEENEKNNYTAYFVGDISILTGRNGINNIIGDIKEQTEIPDSFQQNLSKILEKLQSATKGQKLTSEIRTKIKTTMASEFYDIRMFGAVLTMGTNAGQVLGPVQITFARSVSPVFPMNMTITRTAITRESDRLRKQTEMGQKPIVPYGLYVAHGFYNPKLAEKLDPGSVLLIQENDLELLWEALCNMFEYDRSASRGEMACRGLYIFTHEDKKGYGKAPAHKLFELVRISEKDPGRPQRCFDDYDVTVENEKMPEGITLTRMP
jgi:CRISPR-associated protein Csd2